MNLPFLKKTFRKITLNSPSVYSNLLQDMIPGHRAAEWEWKFKVSCPSTLLCDFCFCRCCLHRERSLFQPLGDPFLSSHLESKLGQEQGGAQRSLRQMGGGSSWGMRELWTSGAEGSFLRG